MLRQLFTRPTKRAIQAGGTVLLAGAMVCGSVPAYATGHLKPHEVTPIVQPDEPAVTCNDRAEYEYYRQDGELGRRVIFNWAQCIGLISEYQKHQMVKKDSVISRGQFVEYLYRLSGSPEVKNLPAQSPYGDIKTDDPRFPVVMWARERGITWGWSDGNFHYDTPASESSTALMVYRLAGSPKVTVAAYDPEKYFPPLLLGRKNGRICHIIRSFIRHTPGYTMVFRIQIMKILLRTYRIDGMVSYRLTMNLNGWLTLLMSRLSK